MVIRRLRFPDPSEVGVQLHTSYDIGRKQLYSDRYGVNAQAARRGGVRGRAGGEAERSAARQGVQDSAERIAIAGKGEGISVDMPFRDLGFNGVPSRRSVMVQHTTDCLAQLTEPPFMVVTLTDIEVVRLESIQFGLKSFNVVIVFKDFMRAPAHINTISVEAFDSVKD